MTASQRTHATSDNSVPRSSRAGTENVISQRDPRLRPIAQHINNGTGAVTAAGIASEDDWTRDGSSDHIIWMQTANLVKPLDDLQEPGLLLTPEVEHFSQWADL